MTPDLDRRLVEAVAAALVEPAAGLPGAATIDIADRVEKVLATYPRFVAPVSEALDALATDRVRTSARIPSETANAPAGPAGALAALERKRPDLFTPLLEVIVGAWALSEPVWEALGYEGQRDLDPAAHPIPEDLFKPLLARGPRWRRPPEVDR
ncbi:MAG: hypothetical protein QM729_08860 [Solirubrobacterales bacterium]